MKLSTLKSRIGNSAFAFRGYNFTNLGRTAELLAHERYGPIVREHLETASQRCSRLTGRPVDIVRRVTEGRETTLEDYSEAICLITAVEHAQLQLLSEMFDIHLAKARLAMGYSLGEINALVSCGVLGAEDALKVPLALSDDCVELARDVTLGVVFSRGRALPLDEIRRLCVRINSAGQGVMGISAYLSPNSILCMGQGDTLDRFRRDARRDLSVRISVRKNDHQWPPLHTPIVWERNIPNRAGVMMHSLDVQLAPPKPPILSLVTGKISYNDFNAREIVQRWTDHPQRLWDVVYECLTMGIETIVHLGPQPNIIPATFSRLHDNVDAQTRGSIGMRALSAVVRRPWLSSLLPERAALLRAPLVQHVIVEDWLLDRG